MKHQLTHPPYLSLLFVQFSFHEYSNLVLFLGAFWSVGTKDVAQYKCIYRYIYFCVMVNHKGAKDGTWEFQLEPQKRSKVV